MSCTIKFTMLLQLLVLLNHMEFLPLVKSGCLVVLLKMDVVANQLAHFLDPAFHCPKHADGLRLCITILYLYKCVPFKLVNEAANLTLTQWTDK